MASRILSVKFIFSCLLTAAFAYGIFEARGYAYLARIFPFYISVVLFVLGVVNIVMEVRRAVNREESTGVGFSDLGADWDIPMSDVWMRFAIYLGMILVMYAGVWIIGYPVCISLFILLFYRFKAEAKWKWSVVAGLAALGFLALVSRLLNMDWPEGRISLPWPLG
jgi:hypothetical protein